MFNSTSPAPNEPVAKAASSVEAENIYVMPEKFHSTVQKSSNVGLIIAVIVLVMVVFGSVGVFIYYYLKLNQGEKTVNVQTPIVTSTAPAEVLVSTTTEATSTEATSTEATTTPSVPTSTPVVTPIVKASVSKSIDTDNDGLTDLEEGVIGSNPVKPSTLSNGYLDGAEIINGYDPVSASKLSKAAYITILNTDFESDNFTVFNIKGWQNTTNPTIKELKINVPTGESIVISIQDNPSKLSATNWYLRNNPDALLSQLKNIKAGAYTGVASPDGLTAYFTDSGNTKVYSFVYNLNMNTEIRYPALFNMIVGSFKLSTSTPANAQ